MLGELAPRPRAWSPSLSNRLFCHGRLTLTSGNAAGPDVSGASTVYFTPYIGNLISLYNGSTWDILTFPETSFSVGSMGTGMYDVFAYVNNGAMALETLAWTNTTTRATALTTQDGVYVKSGAPTRRYLGSLYTASNLTYDTIGLRYVWNYYNRLSRTLQTAETGSWTYGTASWRVAKADSANTLYLVTGVKEDCVHGCAGSFGVTADFSYFSANIAYGATPANVVGIASFRNGGVNGGFQGGTVANMDHMPDIGLQSYSWVEYAELFASTPVTFYSGDSRFNSGMTIYMKC